MNKIRKMKPKKIAIFRALQLGDMLCVIPAIRSLKKSLPDAQITLISLPWAREFAIRFSKYFSDFIPFPGYPGLPEQKYDINAFIRFMNTIKKEKFDIIIQMQGDGSIINPMIESLGAKYTAGYYNDKSYCPDTDLYLKYPSSIPEVERHLALVKHLGISTGKKELEFPLMQEEELDYIKLIKKHNLKPKKYIVIHPGASTKEKRWSAKNFATIGLALIRYGYTVVLTGTLPEQALGKEIKKLIKLPVIDLIGKTNLSQLTFLIKGAKILLCNDTGVSHLADAVKTKSVVIFRKTDPARWAPLNKNLHQIVLPHESKGNDVLKKIESTLFAVKK